MRHQAVESLVKTRPQIRYNDAQTYRIKTLKEGSTKERRNRVRRVIVVVQEGLMEFGGTVARVDIQDWLKVLCEAGLVQDMQIIPHTVAAEAHRTGVVNDTTSTASRHYENKKAKYVQSQWFCTGKIPG